MLYIIANQGSGLQRGNIFRSRREHRNENLSGRDAGQSQDILCRVISRFQEWACHPAECCPKRDTFSDVDPIAKTAAGNDFDVWCSAMDILNAIRRRDTPIRKAASDLPVKFGWRTVRFDLTPRRSACPSHINGLDAC